MSLVSKYSEIISYVISLNHINFYNCEIDKVQTKLYKHLDLVKKDVLADYNENNYNDSLFAICAWIDETILCSSWKDKELWGKKMLQYSFFNTTNAGEIFFTKLDKISPNNIDLLEIYLYVLKLGFRGRYYDSKYIPFINERSKYLYKIVTEKYAGEFDKPLSSCVLFPNSVIDHSLTKKKAVKSKKSIAKSIGLWLTPVFPFIIISILLNEVIKDYFSSLT